MIYPWQMPLWESIQAAKHAQKLPHALLLVGEHGCGNDAFLNALAKSLLCLQPEEMGFACGHCRSCQVFAAHAHPDYMAVGLQDERQAIVIDQIRTLTHFMGLSRSYSPSRIVTLSPADRLNVNAANALLKSLEEPAADTHLLLLTSHPATLLPTIRSRCQSFRLALPTQQMSLTWLQQQSPQQDVHYLLHLAKGRPLDALQMDKSDYLVQRQQWLTQLEHLRAGRALVTDISAQWEKYDKATLLDWQLEALHTLLTRPFAPEPAQLLPFSGEGLRTSMEARKIWSVYETLLELKKYVSHPLNPRTYVEAMLMAWIA